MCDAEEHQQSGQQSSMVCKHNTISLIHIQSGIQGIQAGSATLLSPHESQLELHLKSKISCYRFNK